MVSDSTTQTKLIAADFMRRLIPALTEGPVIISLQGDYGTGKTHFVKGLAQELGVEQDVVSPSYVYMRNYPFQKDGIKGELVHIDAWRVKQASDFQLLGVEQFLKPGFVIAIEWPQEYAQTLLDALEAAHAPYKLIPVLIDDLGGDNREISM